MRFFWIYVIVHAAILIVSLALSHKTKIGDVSRRVHDVIQQEHVHMLHLK